MEITNCVNMKSRQVCFFLYWPVENVQFCINSIGHLGWLRGTSNFPRFHNNVNSLKLWKYISAKGSPKGSFWRNTRDYQGRHNTQFFRRTLLARCVDSRSDVLETTWEDNGGNVILFLFWSRFIPETFSAFSAAFLCGRAFVCFSARLAVHYFAVYSLESLKS